jgi:hypothetical protein
MAIKRYNREEDEEYLRGEQKANAHAASKPGAYVMPERTDSAETQKLKGNWMNLLQTGAPTQYSDAALDAYNKIMNREDFSYDLNGDALYRQYKDQYLTQGNLAMQDTMGKAASLTGGYGNSYATSAGQQAYQGYLQGLTDKIPELYQLALDQYNREGDELYNQYAMAAERDNIAYDRYMDKLGLAYDAYIDQANREEDNFRYDNNMGYQANADAYDKWLKEGEIINDSNNAYLDYMLGLEERDMNIEKHNANMSALDTEKANAASDRALGDAIDRYTYFGDDSALKKLGYTDAQIAHLGEAVKEKDSGSKDDNSVKAPTSAQETRVYELFDKAKGEPDATKKAGYYAEFYGYVRTLMAIGVSADIIGTYLDMVPAADLEVPEVKQAYEELLDYAESLG